VTKHGKRNHDTESAPRYVKRVRCRVCGELCAGPQCEDCRYSCGSFDSALAQQLRVKLRAEALRQSPGRSEGV
jgi:hypothetical protein